MGVYNFSALHIGGFIQTELKQIGRIYFNLNKHTTPLPIMYGLFRNGYLTNETLIDSFAWGKGCFMEAYG